MKGICKLCNGEFSSTPISKNHEREYGDRAHFLCGTSHDHREGMWMIKIKKKQPPTIFF